jgi:hypothetical protein
MALKHQQGKKEGMKRRKTDEEKFREENLLSEE